MFTMQIDTEVVKNQQVTMQLPFPCGSWDRLQKSL